MKAQGSPGNAQWMHSPAAVSQCVVGAFIAPELLAQLFQPFMTRKREGTGLGLWISRSLVERYGGDIGAANRSDGRSGAVFTVRLKAELP